MPITVTAPRHVLTPSGEHEILPRLTAALIEVSGLTGNGFSAPIVGGTVHLRDPSDVYAGGVNGPVVMVEVKLPNIGLPTVEARADFIAAATDIVASLVRPGTTGTTSGSTSSTRRTAPGASAAGPTPATP